MLTAPKRKTAMLEISVDTMRAAIAQGYTFTPAGLYQTLGPHYPERPKFLALVGIKPNARPYVVTPPKGK